MLDIDKHFFFTRRTLHFVQGDLARVLAPIKVLDLIEIYIGYFRLSKQDNFLRVKIAA